MPSRSTSSKPLDIDVNVALIRRICIIIFSFTYFPYEDVRDIMPWQSMAMRVSMSLILAARYAVKFDDIASAWAHIKQAGRASALPLCLDGGLFRHFIISKASI